MEYYHNMSWAHLATGGAGSGMRWSFRNPHTLSPAMHDVEQGMARVVSQCGIDWLRFSPRPSDHLLKVVPRAQSCNELSDVLCFSCSDGEQALIWLVRDAREPTTGATDAPADLLIDGLDDGERVAEFWDTCSGARIAERPISVDSEALEGGRTRLALPQFGKDLAITITHPRTA